VGRRSLTVARVAIVVEGVFPRAMGAGVREADVCEDGGRVRWKWRWALRAWLRRCVGFSGCGIGVGCARSGCGGWSVLGQRR